MRHFIEQFYYGNIEPQERSTPQPPTTRKQMDILVFNEELLTTVLTDKEKELFLAYVDAWHEVNSESNLDCFIMGFRLGAHFAYDTFAVGINPFDGM